MPPEGQDHFWLRTTKIEESMSKLRRDMGNIPKTWLQFLLMKNTSEMKNILSEINSRLDTAEKNNGPESKAIEMLQNETQRESTMEYSYLLW